MQAQGKEMTENLSELLKRFVDAKANIGIVGLGYVGLPLSKAVNDRGYGVIGFDTDLSKIKSLKDGKSYIKSFPEAYTKKLIESGRFTPTSDPSMIAEMDAVLICVPTPLTKYREPDMTYVVATAETILPYLRKNQLIVLESTTYPGTTNEVMKPILERSGLKADVDFFLAYSPEREDPGNPDYSTSLIPKVVGADSEFALELACALYRNIVPSIVPVTSTATAEAVKLTENIFRSVNIGLVNELKMVFSKMGINIWEVIDAAKTKPFGFMPFYPGPGLGGHCIPIDPFYLTWKAREFNADTRFVELAGQINTYMPSYVIKRLRDELDRGSAKGLNGSKVLLLGLAYKKNVDDMRESPSLMVYDKLTENGAAVDYYDPFIPVVPDIREHPSVAGLKSISLSPDSLKKYDAVVICTDHDDIDYQMIVDSVPLVIDSRNATKNVQNNRQKIHCA